MATKKYEGETLLAWVHDGAMLEMLEQALTDAGIPSLRRYYEADSFIHVVAGTTTYAVELYVPERLSEEARDIAQGMGFIEDDEVQED